MENDCINIYKGKLCWLTAHDHDRRLVAYHCAYPYNCKKCEDYKPKEKEITMNPEDYVSYPLALALKNAGFDEPCRDFYWTSDGTFKHTDAPVHKNSEHCTTMVAAPTLWQAQKWLRDRKGIAINVIAHGCHEKYREGKYHWEEIHLPNSNEKGPQWVDWFIYGKHSLFDTYEEALSDGMLQMLELIEKKVTMFASD